MGVDVLHAERAEVVHGGAQADGFGDGRRARLELPGQLVRGEALEGDGADHVAAAQEGGHGFEQLALAVEDADAGRAAHLVAGEGQEVHVERLHVHGQVGHALRGVEQHQRAGRVGARR